MRERVREERVREIVRERKRERVRKICRDRERWREEREWGRGGERGRE